MSPFSDVDRDRTSGICENLGCNSRISPAEAAEGEPYCSPECRAEAECQFDINKLFDDPDDFELD